MLIKIVNYIPFRLLICFKYFCVKKFSRPEYCNCICATQNGLYSKNLSIKSGFSLISQLKRFRGTQVKILAAPEALLFSIIRLTQTGYVEYTELREG